jgi:diguanylate cyclase (GGDEF)-like protein
VQKQSLPQRLASRVTRANEEEVMESSGDSASITVVPGAITSPGYEPGPQRFVLVGLSGPGEGQEIELDHRHTVIGRSSTCDLRILDEHLSRQHVRLTVVPDERRRSRAMVLVEDLESRNGVHVDGQRITRIVVAGGEKILIGRSVLRLDRRDDLDKAHAAVQRAQWLRDPLTGLGNRQALDEALARAERARELEGQPYAVFVVDLDHFKQVNDRFGHAGGDAALRCAAHTLRDGLRTTDAAFRMGGEEFVAILPQASVAEAHGVAERIRASIESTPVPFEDDALILVTASVGVAAGGAHAIADADRAMYAAKNAGRNRVHDATPAA